MFISNTRAISAFHCTYPCADPFSFCLQTSPTVETAVHLLGQRVEGRLGPVNPCPCHTQYAQKEDDCVCARISPDPPGSGLGGEGR